MVGGALERTTPKGAIKTLRVVSHAPENLGGDGFQIAFGNQTIFLPAQSEGRRKKTLGFASLPRGRFAFIGAITIERTKPVSFKGGQQH
jgi:hypothetical protein